jgi:hypothetical protein
MPIEPNESDVLCGREKSSIRHVGNIHFRSYVDQQLDVYKKSSRSDKSRIIYFVYKKVIETQGRFLKQDRQSKEWHDIGVRAAKEKVGHAFRDRAGHDGCDGKKRKAAGTTTAKGRRLPHVSSSSLVKLLSTSPPSQVVFTNLDDEEAYTTTPPTLVESSSSSSADTFMFPSNLDSHKNLFVGVSVSLSSVQMNSSQPSVPASNLEDGEVSDHEDHTFSSCKPTFDDVGYPSQQGRSPFSFENIDSERCLIGQDLKSLHEAFGEGFKTRSLLVEETDRDENFELDLFNDIPLQALDTEHLDHLIHLLGEATDAMREDH